MKRIYSQEDIDREFPPTVDPELWTAVIPSAGKGSRLGYHQPKILFPIAGKPIIEWLVKLLSPYCSAFVFILSEAGKDEVVPYLDDLLPGRYQTAIQKAPRGMGDAVLKAEKHVKTEYTLVIWGDQAGLKKKTVFNSMRAHEHRKGSLLTCPTIWKENPYIHFQRNREGQVEKILQRREKDPMAEEGENDCGLFLFKTRALFNELERARKNQPDLGEKTEEFNLLPLFPLFDERLGALACLRIISEEETIGINTPEEACFCSKMLLKRPENSGDR